MIFDDSLSAVDAQTDAMIREALKKRMAGTTVILIAHRITTLMQADRKDDLIDVQVYSFHFLYFQE